MTIDYTLNAIDQDGNLIFEVPITADEAVKILADKLQSESKEDELPLILKKHLVPAPVRGKRAYKRRAPKEKAKPDDSEVMQNAVRRHPATEQIEEMLIQGLTAAAIMEKVEVSSPTIYLIKKRLQNEGRLTE